MRSVKIEAMDANPEAFYDMCMASPEPVYILEDGKPTLVAMSSALFDRIRTIAAEEMPGEGFGEVGFPEPSPTPPS